MQSGAEQAVPDSLPCQRAQDLLRLREKILWFAEGEEKLECMYTPEWGGHTRNLFIHRSVGSIPPPHQHLRG